MVPPPPTRHVYVHVLVWHGASIYSMYNDFGCVSVWHRTGEEKAVCEEPAFYHQQGSAGNHVLRGVCVCSFSGFFLHFWRTYMLQYQ